MCTSDHVGAAATVYAAADASPTIPAPPTAPQAVAPGQYSSSETVPDGWDLTGIECDDGNSSGDTGTATATINVEAGETVKWTFTNTKAGAIVIEKQTLPDGDPATFDFAGDVAGTIGDDGTITVDVAPGEYTSSETVPAGWALTGIVCDDGNSSGDTATATATFKVEPGETVKCTSENPRV